MAAIEGAMRLEAVTRLNTTPKFHLATSLAVTDILKHKIVTGLFLLLSSSSMNAGDMDVWRLAATSISLHREHAALHHRRSRDAMFMHQLVSLVVNEDRN